LTISQEITDGISKSAQALQAAETGIRQIGSVAQQHTICMYNMFSEIPLSFLLYFSSLISFFVYIIAFQQQHFFIVAFQQLFLSAL
jgi:hypothetical protein